MPPRARPPSKKCSTKRPSGPLLPMPFRAGFGVHSVVMPSSSSPSLQVPNQGTSLSSSSQSLTPVVANLEDCTSPTTPTPFSTPMEDTRSRIGISETSKHSETPENRKKKRWSAEAWSEYDLYDGDMFEDEIDRSLCKHCQKGPVLAGSDFGTSIFSRYSAHCKARLVSLDKEGLAFKDGKGFATYDDFSEEKNEIESYLDESRLSHTTDLDLLFWWKENSHKYPILALLARDILAILITTVTSESSFSMEARVLTKWRSFLHPYTADALLTTRTWLFGFHVDEDNNEHQDIRGIEYQMKKMGI